MKLGADFLTIEIIIAFAMVATRISGLMLTAPILSRSQIPQQSKIAISILLATVTYPEAVNFSERIIMLHPWHIVISLFYELAVGYLIGFLFNLVFDAISTFGQSTGMQMGQGSAQSFNPAIGVPLNPTASLFLYISYFAFLITNGFYIMILIVQKSYEVFPIAEFTIDLTTFVAGFLPAINKIFIFGMQTCFPIFGLLIVIDTFVAMISKILPQASMFFLIMPVKIIIGVIFFRLMLSSFWLNLTTYFNDRLIDLVDAIFMGIN
ncbi:MAG: flagellar biosynthetic protein FliR [Candidatus Caenarcaniphilales bacterium]|nr:flagellar biosynthetic protein FliR [Candidatus Caenarcaniphilales bacterium]